MTTSYRTITERTEGLYKEKGSKFIAFACPAATIEEVNLCLEEIRKEYHDARHHCYAYVLGVDGQEIRANDDGEPKHSAGGPILGQIKSAGVTNTLVIVVRYFGGTKLGVSGLINAYKTASAEALGINQLVTKYVTQPVQFSFPYTSTNEVMKLVDDFNIKVVTQEFEEQCALEGRVKIDELERLISKIDLLQQTGTKLFFKVK